MDEATSRVALVTGGNRGIGFEITRQLAERGMTVLLCARDPEKGAAAAEELSAAGGRVLPRELDVSDSDSVEWLASEVASDPGRLDVLVNNAGILYDTWQKPLSADLAVVHEAFETNFFGAWRMCQAFVPLMRRGGYGRVVNVSSEAGSLASMGAGTPAYSSSKAAMNALTRLVAGELGGSGVLVNSICPGWVATEMGGGSAPRSPSQGAASAVWAATLPDGGPTGGFFRDGEPLRW